MFKKILMALKFGPASMYALEKSLEMARQNDAELHIFHALDYLLQEVDENDPKLVEIREETKRRYKAEIEPLVGDLKNVSFKYLPADPALEVCKQARNMQTDLIILGCHLAKRILPTVFSMKFWYERYEKKTKWNI